MKAAVWVTPTNETPTGRPPDFPYTVVRCKCPQDCYIMTATIKLVYDDGYTPDYVCKHCAPPEVSNVAEPIIENQEELGIPPGATVRLDLEELEGTIH